MTPILKHPPTQIRKRDGRIVPFDGQRISSAISKAMGVSREGNLEHDPKRVSDRVVKELMGRFPAEHIPQVEEIQDLVEERLILMDFPKTAKAYILYRHERARLREQKRVIPERIKRLVEESRQYFSSPYSEFIYYRTYSRWLEEEGRRETWVETVDRYLNYMRENLGGRLEEKEYEEIRQTILKHKALPSMRLLWAAGKAARASHITAYNCVTGDTKILTKELGLVPIEEAYQYDLVHVLSRDAKWHKAVINYFGEQDVTDITLVKGRRKVKISCTLDHRWFVNGNKFKTTAECITSGKKRVGDKIIPVFAPKPPVSNESYRKGIIHGIVYRDGTTTKRNGKKTGHMVRLCKDNVELLRHFKGYKYSYPKSYRGDAVVYLYDRWAKENDLKALPLDVSPSYILGFIRGWIAADGSVNKKGQTILASKGAGVEWLQKYSGIVGLPTGNINLFSNPTNFGIRSEPLYRIYFFHGAIKQDDLLKLNHRAYYKNIGGNLKYDAWTIRSISRHFRREGVYCATVPKFETFLLSEGIVTGNCSYLAPSRLEDFAEIMYLLMCGTGVGFSVEGQTVQQLPIIKHQTGQLLPTFVIQDSKEGWGDALTLGLKTWYQGKDLRFDYSQLRPAGTRLKTMGGRSSGPAPLRSVLDFVRARVLARQGRRLSNLDLHDIVCKIGEVIVVGGVRRCLPQNTLVHTKEGLKPIQKISSGEEVLVAKGRYRRVVASQATGKRRLVHIHTQLGTFQSTPEHRWAVLSDLDGNVHWVEASCLTPNDTLVHIPDIIPGKKTSLPPYHYQKPKYSTTTIEITIPELDEEIAWLIGYLHGDGYVYRRDSTYGEVSFACSPDMTKTAERIKKNLERFGVHPKIVTYPGGRVIRVRTKSNQLANYFYQFKQPKKPLRIPDFILEGRVEIRAAYLAGVFDSDGTIKSRKRKKIRPSIMSIYPDWLRQLRSLLASIGISSRIRENRPAIGNWKPVYNLATISIEALHNFSEILGGRSEKWENDASGLERKKEQNSFVVPRNLLASSAYRNQFASTYYAPSSATALSVSKFELYLKPQNYYRPVKVKNVTKGGFAETYDIQVEGDQCFVAEGMLVHNSALLSLSDLDDEEMRKAKMGHFYIENPQRAMANNSAVYLERPSATKFLEEWLSLVQSGTGERGIFNRGGLKSQLPERRLAISKEHLSTMGSNPCGEIWLRNREFCNLTEVVARPHDTEASLLDKIKIATILGTYQSTLTNFSYLSREWKRNCKEERLLGVSITGQWDCRAVRNARTLRKLKERALEVNREYAKRFGIAPSLAITCAKPSGTVSQVVNSSSGMHPRHSPFYLRRVRISAHDSLFKMLRDQKMPYYPEVGQLADSASTFVFEFPIKSPKGAVFRDDLSALDQLEHWKLVKENYTEHNPSVTISVGENEWIEVANWLYQNWEILGGLSFLPRSDYVYQLAPYEKIDQVRYQELVSKMPKIDFSQILLYEQEDETSGAQELACVAGTCEIEPPLAFEAIEEKNKM